MGDTVLGLITLCVPIAIIVALIIFITKKLKKRAIKTDNLSFEESKIMLNSDCDRLINNALHCKNEYSTLITLEKFIPLETVPIFIQKVSQLLQEYHEKTDKKLVKKNGQQNLIYADNYKVLKEHIREIQQTININTYESDAREHNQKVAVQRSGEVKALIGSVEGRELDVQQLSCIAKESRNHLVVAGAGTGKTTTIIGYIKYLLASKKCTPSEILVLSFTNASATEMKERIAAETHENIDASTFHKLGLNIISRAEGKKPNISEMPMLAFIKDQINRLVEDNNYLKMLNQYAIIGYNKTKDSFEFGTEYEYEQYLKENPPITLLGETVKSYGEMEIANFLFQNGITYEYEKPYKIDTRTEQFSQYKPDFYLPEYDIYIEHFGTNKKGEVPIYFEKRNGMTATETYQASMKWKRELHEENHTTMVEAFAYERIEGTLCTNLESKLKALGVRFDPIDQKDLWNIINENYNDEKSLLDGIVVLIETVINLTKSRNYTIEKVRELNRPLHDYASDLLLNLIEPIFNAYDAELKKNNEIDFNDMINNAAALVQRGLYHHNYRYVLVDEYQDISSARYSLLKALRDDKEYNLFCVGDDWQSIYRFAGSDIGYILNFENYWGISEKSKIETTYRFKGSLIDVSSSFIMKNPMQIKKSIVSKETDNSFALKLVEADSYNKSVQALNSELLSLPQNASVFIIGRYSFDINVLKEIRNGKIINKYRPEYKVRYDNENQRINISYVNRPDLNIQFITAHRSKGLQADYIFIINNKNDRLGFPSKIQDAPILNLLLDNCDTFEHAEERRLYYVAMTRAKEKTVMIAPPTHKQSVFIGELKREYGEAFTQYKTCPLCGGKLIMRSGPYGNFYGCENYKNKDCRYKEKIN